MKIYGALEMPLGFVVSFYGRVFSGSPFERSISVYPPTGWAAANGAIDTGSVSILAESQGSRRNVPTSNVDARVEKQFGLTKSSRFTIGLEVYNLLGNSYLNMGYSPGGTWIPTLADPNTGTYTVASTYGKVSGASGVRTYRLNVNFSF